MSAPKPDDDWLDVTIRFVTPWIVGAFVLTTLVLIPVLSIGFTLFVFLKTGAWEAISTSEITAWTASTDWVGFNQVANWVLNTWVGFPSIALGLFAALAYAER